MYRSIHGNRSSYVRCDDESVLSLKFTMPMRGFAVVLKV